MHRQRFTWVDGEHFDSYVSDSDGRARGRVESTSTGTFVAYAWGEHALVGDRADHRATHHRKESARQWVEATVAAPVRV